MRIERPERWRPAGWLGGVSPPREVLEAIPQLARFFFPLRAEGIAAITDRSNPLTASDESKTAATSGSSTTATLSGFIRAANRFGRDFE
jgi:hypothetical protein